VKIFDWHPLEASIMVGGCTSGQLVIWDISSHVDYLKRNECTWDHKVFLSPPTDRLHIQEGYVPVLYWSAESDKEHSHLNGVEFLQWLPKNVWVRVWSCLQLCFVLVQLKSNSFHSMLNIQDSLERRPM
jgi:hypothetical protein